MLDDENSTPQGDQQSRNPHHDAGQQRGIPAGEIPDPKDNHSGHSQRPFLPIRLWHRYNFWRTNPFRVKRSKSTIAEMVTIFVTCVIAIIGFLQYSVYRQQKRIMESGSGQTQKLIDAANIQACAARNFAASAEGINKGIVIAVKQLNLQATELTASAVQAKRLAKATEEANANVVNSDRPWMGPAFSVDGFVAGKTPTYSIGFVNSGKRPAKVTLTQTMSIMRDFGSNPHYQPYDTTPSTTIIVPGQSAVAAWKEKDVSLNPITQTMIDALDSGIIPFRVYGKIEYTDIRTNAQYWTHACWRYTPKQTATSGGFSNCAEYNDAK